MTRAFFFVVFCASACVLSKTGVGDPCESSATCFDDSVCVLLDEEAPDGESVCMPMRAIDEPVPCTSADECFVAGYPIDATCNGTCSCVTAEISCPSSTDVVAGIDCRCLPGGLRLGDDQLHHGRCVEITVAVSYHVSSSRSRSSVSVNDTPGLGSSGSTSRRLPSAGVTWPSATS